jgi:hypothetical protein
MQDRARKIHWPCKPARIRGTGIPASDDGRSKLYVVAVMIFGQTLRVGFQVEELTEDGDQARHMARRLSIQRHRSAPIGTSSRPPTGRGPSTGRTSARSGRMGGPQVVWIHVDMKRKVRERSGDGATM